MDETGVPLDMKPPKVICKRGQVKIHYNSGNNSQVTVLDATGQALPTFVIICLKILWTRSEVSGIDGFSKSTWTHPILLLVDGHSSYYNPESIIFTKVNSVIFFAYQPIQL